MHAASERLSNLSPRFAPIRTGRLVGHDVVMLEGEGLDLPLGASARIRAADGRSMRGEVVGFRGNRTLLVPLDGAAPYRAGSRIEPDAEANRIACGSALLGRIVGAHGEPLDGRGVERAPRQYRKSRVHTVDFHQRA